MIISSTIILFLNVCRGEHEITFEKQMQRVLDCGIDEYNIHGVSATIIFPDNQIWTGVSGFSHDTVFIRPEMLFGIGSVTKNMVAALVLKLAEENRLSLEDPLSKWLPAYTHVDSMITIRQLLNHTSGLYMFWDNSYIWDALTNDRGKFWTPEEVLQFIKKPYFTPGNGWHYSNTNYLLLALIIKKVTGSGLSDELKKHFWQPLGLNDVYLIQEETIPDHQVHVYGDDFQFGSRNTDVTFLPRTAHESITYGSSGLFISSENLALWSHAIFGGKVLKRTSLNEMLKFIEFDPVANMRAYGLGTQVYDRGFTYGKEAIGHGGGNIGSSTYMVYFPEYPLTLVVMINAYPNEGLEAITRGLFRLVLKDINTIDLILYSDYSRYRYIVISVAATLIIFFLYQIRKKQKLLQQK